MSEMTAIRARFKHEHPEAYFLSVEDSAGLAAYLRRFRWLETGEVIQSVRKAGEGNMNCSLRVKTNARSFIVKQGRPWVEKYPGITAPWGRTAVEACFYRLAASDVEVATRMPDLIGDDPKSQVLVLTDLGEASDLTNVYGDRPISPGNIESLVDYLLRLHGLAIPEETRPALTNRDMRRLNHEHIFRLPLALEDRPNLEHFTQGLSEVALWLKKDRTYVREVARLGAVYLADGAALLHGDFFPGSWLQTANGVRVIDPEFCFLGPVEFDLGVMAAHLLLSNHQAVSVRRLLSRYGAERSFDKALALRFAGVEIMRRLMGVAQLPLTRDLGWKQRLLEHSRRLVLDGGDAGL